MPDTKHHSIWWRRLLKLCGYILLGLTASIIALFTLGGIWPLKTRSLQLHSAPVNDYSQARAAADQYIRVDTDNPAINPDCYPVLMDHGHKTEKVLVISHGYTSCPRQFQPLAQEFYDRGYNVFITRIPQHGYKDLLTTALADLTAEDMAAKTNQAVDIAQGLGDKVDLMGLSMGGTIVTWIGQNRSDVHNTVAINPMYSIWPFGPQLNRQVTGLLDLMPNMFFWWDNELKANLPGPGYTYPRFATRGIGQALRQTIALEQIIDRAPAKTQTLTIISNGNDKTVDNNLINTLVTRWRRANSNVVTYEFPASDKLNHDLIDIHQPDQNVELSYPRIIELTDTN